MTETISARRRYAIVAPCRDEAATMRRTLDSLLAQTVPPDQLVVVDDGSTDGTREILESYRARMPYLRVVERADRGGRQVGAGVVVAFYEGLAHIDLSRVDYLCKLDMDLDLPAGYFAGLCAKMEADPELAACSGKPWFVDPGTGALVSENIGDQFAVGMTKFYRLVAFRAVGGFVAITGWDGIDSNMCRMIGMKAESFHDPDLRFIHLRPMGSSHRSMWHGRMRHGLGAWNMGVPPVFQLFATIFRLNKRPYVVGALGMAAGYVQAWAGGARPFDAPGYRRFVRRYYLRSLVIGRARAAEEARLAAKRDRADAVAAGPTERSREACAA